MMTPRTSHLIHQTIRVALTVTGIIVIVSYAIAFIIGIETPTGQRIAENTTYATLALVALTISYRAWRSRQ